MSSGWGELTATAKQKGISRQREWQIRNKEKSRAHRTLAKAVKSGRIIRPKHCRRCGLAGKVQAHHLSYVRWDDVTWLCRRCHLNEHTKKAAVVCPLCAHEFQVSIYSLRGSK